MKTKILKTFTVGNTKFKLPTNLSIHVNKFRITKYINGRNIYINTNIKVDKDSVTKFRTSLTAATEFLESFNAACITGVDLKDFFENRKIPSALLHRPDLTMCDLLDAKFTSYELERTPEDQDRPKYKASTLDKFKYSVNFWKSELGSIKLEEINYPMILNILLNEVEKVEKQKKRGPSKKAILDKTKPLRDVLSDAIKHNIIKQNPFNKEDAFSEVYKRCCKPKKKIIFTPAQVKQILMATEGEFQGLLVMLFFTGCRASELFALQYSDCNLENGIISINKCVYRGSIDTPKTKNGIRELCLLPIALSALKEMFRNRKSKDDFVFHTQKGLPMVSVTNLSRQFKRLLKKLGLPETTPHSARHFFTSLMINYNEKDFVTSQYLGHVDTTMVTKVYSHQFKQEENEPLRLNLNLTNIKEIITT